MKLTTDYREQKEGVLTGQKQYYLMCKVEFTNEERVLVDERGMYDHYIQVPAATPPPTRAGDFTSMVMRVAGIALMPIGFISSCATGLAQSNASGPLFFLFLLGVVLFAIGWYRDRTANKRVANPDQTLTFRKLLSNPSFEVHAFSLSDAQADEVIVRSQLEALVKLLRSNVVVPEKNTYEL